MSGVVWFAKLIDKTGGRALLTAASPSGLIVCREVAIPGGSAREFAQFSSIETFTRHQFAVAEKDRTFYEVIIGSRAQKMYLDLDLEREKVVDAEGPEADSLFARTAQELFEAVITATMEAFGALHAPVEPSDFLLYQSHGPRKYSFHVLVDLYYVGSNLDAKRVFAMIRTHIPSHLLAFVDTKVYNPHQQLRILGCHKVKEPDRVKKYMPAYTYRGMEIRCRDYGGNEAQTLRDSLVGFTLNTRRLNLDGESLPVAIGSHFEPTDLPTEVVNNIIELISQATKVQREDLPFQFRAVVDCFVLLKRTRRSHCSICGRVHDNENPYVFVPPPTIEDLPGAKREVYKVLYTCRRCEPQAFLRMGSIAVTRPAASAAAPPLSPAESSTADAESSTADAAAIESPLAEELPEVGAVAKTTAVVQACSPPEIVSDCGNEAWFNEKLEQYRSVLAPSRAGPTGAQKARLPNGGALDRMNKFAKKKERAAKSKVSVYSRQEVATNSETIASRVPLPSEESPS